MTAATSRRIAAVQAALSPIARFLTESTYGRQRANPRPGACDFALGNPQEPPLPGFVAALQRWAQPQRHDWFAYRSNEAGAQAAAAAALRERRGVACDPEDICITNASFAGLAVVLRAITDPGDEVIFFSPPWFFYEALLVDAGAAPVRLFVDRTSFDLDLAALAAAITPRTRAVLVNSPHNPTGRVYPPALLERLARLLTDASRQHGRTIYLISDEAYSRIVYDGRPCPSPAAYYPNTFLVYTFGKTLLTPGERLGYVALPQAMPERKAMRQALFAGQLVAGHAFANAVMQYALPELEGLSIDVSRLQRRRDRLVSALRAMGYELHAPEGTFYLLPRSPWADDWAFAEWLAQRDIFCLPGSVAEVPGYFRLSLTANDEMVEKALPVFEAARRAPPPGAPR